LESIFAALGMFEPPCLNVANLRRDHHSRNICVSDLTAPCSLASCIPAGSGRVAQGSSMVFFGLPAATKDGLVAYAAWLSPIPAPVGTIKSASSDIDIGG